MYFCNIDEREAKEIIPGVRIRTFWQEKMLLSVVDLDANIVLPLHHHEHEQFGSVISGEMELTISGETRLLKAGDAYTIPGNVEHMARTGEQPARVIDIFAPVREDYKY